MKKLWLLLFVLLPVVGMGQVITTFAGGGSTLGDGGPATAALVPNPGGVVFGQDGSLYITTQTRIRKVNVSGTITTIAGTGVSGYSGDGGPATAAKIKWAHGITVDTLGNIIFCDFFNYVIRKINVTTGIITTICGNGIQGYTGDNGPASAAQLYTPNTVFFDKRTGNLYITENNAHVVRKINPSGIITTIAGTGVAGFNGDGLTATATELYYPEDVAVDSIGNIYISDGANNRIRKVNTSGIVSTIAGNGSLIYSGSGGPATSAQLVPECFALDAMQNLYISGSEHVSKINVAGMFYNVAGTGIHGYSGDGGPATAAELDHIHGIAIDGCNNLYIADGANNRIRKVTFNPSCNPTLKTEQIKPPSEISIYPNPATTELTISAPGKIKEVAVYDLLGQIGERSVGSGERVLRIPVAGISPGIYFVRIVDEDGGVVVRRVVKE